MSFKAGLYIGVVIGYILGARAGRERYEQIASWGRSLGRSEPAQQLSTDLKVMVDRAGERLEDKANEGVAKVTDRVRGSRP